jgi:signal transduction histidine kinase
VILALRIPPQDKPGEVAEIAVADTSIGISPEDQPRVFERFYRAAKPLNGDFPGSGIGLALAHWIAEHHHTGIKMESSLGVGSRFSLFIEKIQFPDPKTQDDRLLPPISYDGKS